MAIADTDVMKRRSKGEACCHPDGPWLPATAEYFSRGLSYRDGLRAQCKACRAEYSRRYNAEHPEEERERKCRYYAEHLEERREYDHRYRAEHTEERREYNRRWRTENLEKARALYHNRRARLLSAPGSHTVEDIRLQVRAQTDKKGRLICWWYDEPIEGTYHADHRIPLTKGGGNGPGNLVIAHATCNLKKNAKLPGEFNGRLL